ncbi:MAG TPA: class I SAM-dependent methyltransferase [Acidobacteriota bacterium]
MILDRNELFYLTQLGGYRIVNHQLRKRLLIDLTLRHFPAGAMLADIGCAAGDLSMELQALGYRMTGIDFEPERMARAGEVAAKHELNVRFLNQDLRNVSRAEEFDGMIMGEVLEHFSQPRAILEQHLPLLKVGGKIIVTVPNMVNLRARFKVFFFGQFADHNPQHLYYFTHRRFIEHFQGVPIEILEIFSFLVEVTLPRHETLARVERLVLSPLRLVAPWCGSHLVAVLKKIPPATGESGTK